jgi:predicted metallopeptidase
MEWVHISKDIGDAIDEIETSSDRAAAIVAAALLEDHLTTSIRHYLHRDNAICNSVFKHDGPLGTFSNKIDMSFLIGIFSKRCHKELDTIREIRNKFAHIMKINSFDYRQIKDLTNNLVRHEQTKIIITDIHHDPKTFAYSPEAEGPLTSRQRYMRSCKLYIGILTMNRPPRPKMQEPFF